MNDEIDRITRVYRDYKRDPVLRKKWDHRNIGNRHIANERRRAMLRLMQSHGFHPLGRNKILEVGCGEGHVIGDLLSLGADPRKVLGVDVVPEHVREARERYGSVSFECVNAAELDCPSASFDLVLAFTVFSSVKDEATAIQVGRQMRRVLKPTGAVLWYDMRLPNPWNPHTKPQPKHRIGHLFPDFHADVVSLTVMPPLVRRLGRSAQSLYPKLAVVPVLRTHYMALLTPPRRRRRPTP